jgi:hypothetical protein
MLEAQQIVNDTWRDNPTSLDAIGAIITAEGNIDLAAEMLFGIPIKGQIHPKAQLIAVIAADPSATQELQHQLRTLATLQTFQSMQRVGFVVEGSLTIQEPADLIKLYTQLLSLVATFTDDHTQQVNANVQSTSLNLTEVVLRQLPPEVREALKVLSTGDNDDSSSPLPALRPNPSPFTPYTPPLEPPALGQGQDELWPETS